MKFLLLFNEFGSDFIESIEVGEEDEGAFDPEILKKGWYYILERDFVPPIGEDIYRLHFSSECGGSVSFGPKAIWDYPEFDGGKGQVHIWMEIVDVDGGLPVICEILTKHWINDFDHAVSLL
ncbi:MAG: hypothetical protein ACOCU8_00690 [Patescibacteria group bacterium]